MASSPFFSDLIGTQLKANSGQSGLTGLAAGLVFKRVWRRSPMIALALGGAYIYYQSVQAAKQAKAKKVIKQQGLADASGSPVQPVAALSSTELAQQPIPAPVPAPPLATIPPAIGAD